MSRLIYLAIASLDGYIADENGNFDWAVPDEEVHAFINDLDRPLGTCLYGRRMYETMVGWETDPTLAEQSPLMRDFAQIWQAADKIVYSRTLKAVSTARTRIERDFDTELVRQMKGQAGRDILVGGPDLAAQTIKGGWSTSGTCSLRPSWLEAANGPSPTMSAWSSNCWTNAGTPLGARPVLPFLHHGCGANSCPPTNRRNTRIIARTIQDIVNFLGHAECGLPRTPSM